MTKARLKNGVFEPLEPLPVDWKEGMEVNVERAIADEPSMTADEWKASMDRVALDLDPGDEDIIRDAIAQIRSQIE